MQALTTVKNYEKQVKPIVKLTNNFFSYNDIIIKIKIKIIIIIIMIIIIKIIVIIIIIIITIFIL